jgi:hypothetical protein
MILTIPHQALEIGFVHVSPFQCDEYGRNLANLTYKDHSVQFKDICVMTPSLKIVKYNPSKNQLILDIKDHPVFMSKLYAFQEHLVNTFVLHQQTLLKTQGLTLDDIRSMFQFLLNGNLLSVFLYPSSIVHMPDHKDKFIHLIEDGTSIRFILRIYGITIMSSHNGLPRLRIQHSVPSLWKT